MWASRTAVCKRQLTGFHVSLEEGNYQRPILLRSLHRWELCFVQNLLGQCEIVFGKHAQVVEAVSGSSVISSGTCGM